MHWEPGDIAACYGTNVASRIISWGTATPFAPRRLRVAPSHVAMLAEAPGGELAWVESTTFCNHPCIINGRHAQGVQAHLPETRVGDYLRNGGHVDVYRLVPIFSLTFDESGLLRDVLFRHFIEKQIRYDVGGALVSGTRLVSLSRMLFWDFDQVFCSELVAAALMRIGRMNHANATRYNPGRLLRQLVRHGTYRYVGRATVDGPIRIAPASIFEDDGEERQAA